MSTPSRPSPTPNEAAAWLYRQAAKLAALACSIGGGLMDAGEGRAVAWIVACIAALVEIDQSRRADNARINAIANFGAIRREAPPP